MDVDATRPCQRRYINGCCSGFHECLRGSARRGAGGEDVIDKKHVLSADRGGLGDFERTANVLAPLGRGQAGLSFRGAETHEGAGRELELRVGIRAGKGMDGCLRESASLIESALAILCAVEGDRDDQHRGRSLGENRRNGLCEHGSEVAGGWMHPVVLQRVNGVAQLAIVSAEGDCSCKRRSGRAAGAAQRGGFDAFDNWRVEGVTASAADNSGLGWNLRPASVTNWNGSESRQRGAAKRTGGGKECGTNCVYGTSEDAHNRAPTGCLR